MKELFSRNKLFFLPYLVFVLGAGICLLLNKKGDFLLWLNLRHSPFLDYFFTYVTWLGDGIFYIIVVLTLAFFNRRYALLGLMGFISSGLASQLIKKVLFPSAPRPIRYFNEELNLHLVEGVKVYEYGSFPSGHTATAFSLFLLLALISSQKTWGLVFFLLALLVGISRVYLVQHFLLDIYVGSILGLSLTLIIFKVFHSDK